MKIVINGCFDLFHEGHKFIIQKALSYISEGYAAGEILFMVNSDDSVTRLKRRPPIDNVTTRAGNVDSYCRSIAADLCGDKRFPKIITKIFSSEEELSKEINKFEPSMIIKGNDRPDVREITGSDRWPILIIPRLTNSNGAEISSTMKRRQREGR